MKRPNFRLLRVGHKVFYFTELIINVNELQVFEKEEFGKVRVIESNNDVSEILDYNTTAHMTRLLEDDEKGVQNVDTPGGSQKVCIINESGLYHAVITSRKAEAKKFRKWVTSEVLPSIRKTGSYTVNVPKTFAEALRLAADQQEQIEKQQLLLKEQAPKVEFAEAVTGLLNMNIGRNKLFEFLRNNKILNNDNCPYQRYCDLGYFRLIESKFTVNDETKISLKTVVFQKGVNFIRKLLIKEGYKENKGGKDEKRV